MEQLIPAKIEIQIEDIQFSRDFPLQIFDDRVVAFLDDISRLMLREVSINRIPAVTALAFWLRKANIHQMIAENQSIKSRSNVSLNPIGYVFHVCPSNVDTMFFYSLTVSLLTGNKNILRVSKKLDSNFIHILFRLINQLLSEARHQVVRDYIQVVSYGHDHDINQYFSENADARIIWGGDHTVELFKQLKTKPRVKDIYFADRQSLSLISLEAFAQLDNDQKKEITTKFYNDTFTFDQKGCSSPQILLFLGKDEALKEFYEGVLEKATTDYQTDYASLSSLKLNHQVLDAANDAVTHIINTSGLLSFLELADHTVAPATCGGGYFYYKTIQNLEELLPFIDKKTQTLSYFGLKATELEELCRLTYGKGIDRIVPVGKALDFHYIWDGYHLMEELTSKKICIND